MEFGNSPLATLRGCQTERRSLTGKQNINKIFIQVRVVFHCIIECLGDDNSKVAYLCYKTKDPNKGTKHLCGYTRHSYMTPTWGGSRRSKSNQQFATCSQLNISQCAFVESQESVLLLVYNPQSVKTYHYVRLPAIALHYVIRNAYDEELEYQLVGLAAAVANLPGRSANTNHELVFEAENVPPLGYAAFYVAAIKDPLGDLDYMKNKKLSAEPELVTQISNEYLKININKVTGLLESIQHIGGAKISVNQNFYYYGQTRGSLQSGAYSFRPDQRPVAITEKVTYNTIRGPLVKEIQQRFSSWAQQTLRLYRGEEYLELDWVIGPIPISTDLGKEIVSIFSTNISNRGEFFTDSNSRQMMKRSCWNDSAGERVKKPLASCYYPVTSRICINGANGTTGMCVLTDRCQGGTSFNDGEIELMMHRRLLTDDGFGLDETLNEEEFGGGLVVRGQYRLFLGNRKQEADELPFSERMNQAASRWQWEPWIFAAAGDKVNRRKWQGMRNKRFSALRVHGLPRHVRVLTLEPWKASSVLLRLENTLENKDKMGLRLDLPEELPLPSHVTVELKKLFQHLKIRSVRETTLGANQWLEEARQMDWSTRYVYTGGDEGILPEDIDYVEEDKSKHRDTVPAPNPDEETDYVMKRSERRRDSRKHRRTTRYEERRKRSINITENFVDNVFHNDEKKIKIVITTESSKEAFKKQGLISNVSQLVGVTTLKPLRAPEFFSELRTSESLEEETGAWVSLRRKSSEPTMDTEVMDDGVTRSMYEMYYKKNSDKLKKTGKKKPEFKKLPKWLQPLSSSKKVDKDSTSDKEVNDAELLNFDPRTKTYESGEEKQSDEQDEELNMELSRMRNQGDEQFDGTRKKRASSQKTPIPHEEPDFIVTLRPTQIRTFVVRFESSRNNYVV